MKHVTPFNLSLTKKDKIEVFLAYLKKIGISEASYHDESNSINFFVWGITLKDPKQKFVKRHQLVFNVYITEKEAREALKKLQNALDTIKNLQSSELESIMRFVSFFDSYSNMIWGEDTARVLIQPNFQIEKFEMPIYDIDAEKPIEELYDIASKYLGPQRTSNIRHSSRFGL